LDQIRLDILRACAQARERRLDAQSTKPRIQKVVTGG
jgi:hypothetical protein